MNFSFICMKNDMSGAILDNNGTLHSIYDYSSSEKAELIWAVAIGTIVGTIPYNWAYVKYGAKYVFLSAGILSIISTVLVPTLAAQSYIALLFVRLLQGIAYSADFAVIGIICVKWAPLDEIAFFISVLTVFSPFANIITTGITGVLCTSSLGWRASYYFHAVGGAICFVLWCIVYSDCPLSCKSITTEEMANIQKGKSAEHFNKDRNVPYFKMITNPALISVWFNAFMDLSMSIMIITYSPIYLHEVLGFPIEQTAAIIGITSFVQLPFKFTAAFISDRLMIFSPKTKMLIFNTISCGIVSLLFGGFGFVPKDHRWYAMVLLGVLHCLMSTNCGGFYQCGRYVAQQYADVVIAAIQFCKCLALFFVPAVVKTTVSNEHDRSQWALAFIIMAVFLFIANCSAYFLFTDQPAEFTKVVDEPEKLKEAIA
ncbi:unnamed protein product [Caenorhabditis angaria]|uniref:Major facilitator superfamily (MFS) profile domain-containing protein n=1 Tax=Caenorhabditis angaria TaxID=860376 RepID=A0A9P1NAJ3_9PELO|nr:unnamed protein product [Caenorhabditis angaria]